jgi:hypothetical protein
MQLLMVKHFIVQRVPPSFSYRLVISVYLHKGLQPSSVYKPYSIMPFNLGIKAKLCLLLQHVLFFHGQANFIGSIYPLPTTNLSHMALQYTQSIWNLEDDDDNNEDGDEEKNLANNGKA